MGRFKDYLIETAETLSKEAIDIAESIASDENITNALDEVNVELGSPLTEEIFNRIRSAIAEELYKISKYLLGEEE